MSETTRDLFEAFERVLLRCWIIGTILMLFSLVVFLLTGEMIHEIHGRIFGLTSHELDLIMYCGLGFFKLFVFIFFLIPWIAIRMVLKKAA